MLYEIFLYSRILIRVINNFNFPLLFIFEVYSHILNISISKIANLYALKIEQKYTNNYDFYIKTMQIFDIFTLKVMNFNDVI